MMLAVIRDNPSVSASLSPCRSIARFAASRTRASAHGDFASHCSAKYSHSVTGAATAFNVRPGVRRTSSASTPRNVKATSASPRFSMASRVDESGTARKTSVLTLGVLRQYCSLASRTSSTPGLKEANLYGPAPMGARLNPSSPTFSRYFFGTIHPAPVAGVPIGHEVRPRLLEPEAHSLSVDYLD